MYESPITLIVENVEKQLHQEKEQSEQMIYQCVNSFGVVVDKEELVKALKYDRDQYNEGYKDGVNEATRWIPIKDRIPVPGRNILVCDSDGDIYVSYMRIDHTFGFDTSGNKIKNVVAWMYSPEPYKESEE